MPELPEVETMRRGVLPIVGSCITSVTLPRCKLKPITLLPKIAAFRRRAVGREITAIDRLGKRVLVRLDSDDIIIFEPRMTGLVLLADPPNQAHLRLQIALDGEHPQLLFWDRRGLGSVRLFSPKQMNEKLGPHLLGPDALAITVEQLRARLGKSGRAVKVALLDQKALAGVGNLYAAEILFRAGVHPEAKCQRLSVAQWTRIHEAMNVVLQTAIKYEGSTLSDGTYRNALNEAGGYQAEHLVYDREGQSCVQCEAEIVRIVQAQRSTFFCRRCQNR